MGFLFIAMIISAAHGSLLDDLETCEHRRDESALRVERVSHAAVSEFMLANSYFANVKRNRQRVNEDIDFIHQVKARCVYRAVADRVGQLVPFSKLGTMESGRQALNSLALYEGLRRSRSHSQGKCTNKRREVDVELECARRVFAREIRRKAMLVAIDTFFYDFDRATQLQSSATIAEVMP